MKDDDYIINLNLKIYSHVTKIFLGCDRLGISASPDIRGTPRTNRLKNTYSEQSLVEVEIKKEHKGSDDYFRGRALLAKSSNPSLIKETSNKQSSVGSLEEAKNSQSSKSTPEFLKHL